MFVISCVSLVSLLRDDKRISILFYSLSRCARRRTATSSTWMWSTSHPRSYLSASMKSSSQYTPGTRPDRWVVEVETRWHMTNLPLAHCALNTCATLPTGRPRLRIQRVSEEVQASCGCDRHRHHLQSVDRRRAHHHRSALILRHGPQHSNLQRGRETEDVEAASDAANDVRLLTPITACCFLFYFFLINLLQFGWHSSTYTK